LALDLALIHHDDVVSLSQEVYSMSNQDSSSIFQHAKVNIVDDLLSNMGIQGRDGIIHEIDFLVLVHSSGKT
jgi:hypothetical protein